MTFRVFSGDCAFQSSSRSTNPRGMALNTMLKVNHQIFLCAYATWRWKQLKVDKTPIGNRQLAFGNIVNGKNFRGNA